MTSEDRSATGRPRGDGNRQRLGWGQAFLQCFLPGCKSRDGQQERGRLVRWPHNLCTVAVIIILLIPWFPFVKFYLASNAGQEVVVTLFHTCWDDAGDQKCVWNFIIPLMPRSTEVVLPFATMPMTGSLWYQALGGALLFLGLFLYNGIKGTKETQNTASAISRLGWRNIIQLFFLTNVAFVLLLVALAPIVSTAFGMKKSGMYTAYGVVMFGALLGTAIGAAVCEHRFRNDLRRATLPTTREKDYVGE